MPVTAKLSRKFYATFGDEIANELVEWFNQVDATYRSDLRELNELNFSRFDAKLEQRVTELDAKWDRRFAALDAKWERRVVALDAKWEQRWGQLDAKIDQRVTELDAKLETRVAQLRREISTLRAELIKWMFVFWVGTVFTVVGAMIVLRTLP